MKGRALRRALATGDAQRVYHDLPAIRDTTEMIDPETAYVLLQKNQNNRPINWKKVQEYAEVMKAGKWELHAQGIILDVNENILTGQKRLWAVIYANVTVPFRVSRGNPTASGKLIDRHVPQSARDLASRDTGVKHGPTEASLARAVLALEGKVHPTSDEIADALEQNWKVFQLLIDKTKGTKKTKAVLVVLAALAKGRADCQDAVLEIDNLVRHLEADLRPQTVEQCWGRGAAFAMVMKLADRIVR